MRSIQVNIDRTDATGNPNFTINPTNCDPTSVESQGVGDQGTVANFSSYFHAVNCSALAFKPKMTVRQLGGRKGTRRAANPALQFDLTTRPGDANIKSLAVTLSERLRDRPDHLGQSLRRERTRGHPVRRAPGDRRSDDHDAAARPAALRAGPTQSPAAAACRASPSSSNGQVDLLPRAESKTLPDGRLRTTVPIVPDAPIGHFHLVVFGGKHGYLANTRDLCAHTPLVEVAYTAQNGTHPDPEGADQGRLRRQGQTAKAPPLGAIKRPDDPRWLAR